MSISIAVGTNSLEMSVYPNTGQIPPRHRQKRMNDSRQYAISNQRMTRASAPFRNVSRQFLVHHL